MSPQVQQTFFKVCDNAAILRLLKAILESSDRYPDLVPLANRVLAPLADCHKESA